MKSKENMNIPKWIVERLKRQKECKGRIDLANEYQLCTNCPSAKEFAFNLFKCAKDGHLFDKGCFRDKHILKEEDFYVYHGTDIENVSEILKDGFLKPQCVTKNQNYSISYKDRIYFEFELKEVSKWVGWEDVAIFRILRSNLPQETDEDDISMGIAVKTEKLGNLELSLDKGETWKSIPMK